MNNPILGGVPNPMMANLAQIKNMWKTIQAASNPQTMLSKMITSNPKGKEIMDIIDSCNGNYEQAFRQKAKDMGIDPDEFINNLK